MSIEQMKMMKDQLMSCVQTQMGDLKNVDAEELGEAVDMIKDLAEAIYYCTITESMEKSEEGSSQQQPMNVNYYTTPVYNRMMYPDLREMERSEGYMYYPSMNYASGGSSGGSGGGGGRGGSSGGNSGGGGGRGGSSGGSSGGRSGSSGGRSYYTEMPMQMEMPYEMERDPRQGRSAMRRRMYMEGKEMNNDPKSQLRELEAYLQQLSTDITEMVKDASPEERAVLHQKMTTLASKIA